MSPLTMPVCHLNVVELGLLIGKGKTKLIYVNRQKTGGQIFEQILNKTVFFFFFFFLFLRIDHSCWVY